MKHPVNSNAPAMPGRRRLLVSLAGIATGLGLWPARAGADELKGQVAADDTDGHAVADGDAWMRPLKGKHRQLFHAMTLADEPLRMTNNFLDAYRDVYKVPAEHVNAVVGVHGSALTLGLGNALWKKYELGKAVDYRDPQTGAYAVRNVFASGGPYTVEALQKRGVTFIMCNTALRNRARMMSDSLGVPYETLYAELVAGRIPGFSLVPAMVVAINRAQERGFTYIRAS